MTTSAKKMEKFANITTIHGLRDLIKADKRWIQIVWAIAIVGAVALLAEEVIRASREYARGPTAMSITAKPLAVYPTIYICPHNSYDDTKARNMGFSDDDLALLLYVVAVGDIFGVDDGNIDPGLVERAQNITKNDLEIERLLDSKDKIYELMKMNNLSTIRDLIDIFTSDALWLYQDDSNLDVKQSKISYIAAVEDGLRNGKYICYRVSSVPTLSEEKLLYGDIHAVGFDGGQGGLFIIGEDPYARFQAVFYERGCVVYTVRIKDIESMVTLNKPNAPCNENISSYQGCIADCEFPYDVCAVNVTLDQIPVLNYTISSFAGALATLKLGDDDNEGSEFCDNLYAECRSKCNPCVKWKYIYETSHKNYRDDDYGRSWRYLESDVNDSIALIIHTASEFKVIEEYYTTSMTTLLSGLGGLVGLFTGASVLSIVQVLMFFCRGEGWWKKLVKKKTVDVGIQTHREK